MAKILRKKQSGNILNKKSQSGFFSKLTESYTSLILGIIVVLIAGIIFISFARINRNSQTSSTRDVSKTGEASQDSNTSSTYTVKPGDDLWTISKNIYNDGYKWGEIAKLNKLENPGTIHAGNQLKLPAAASMIDQKNSTAQESTIQKISISANTYTVTKGDNLWDIAVRAYGDGFKWPDIAKANKLGNPDIIHPGNILKIPR